MTKQSKELVQILIPLTTGEGAIEKQWFEALMNELTDRFGGATSFKQSPGQGHWDSGEDIERESIVLIEVMSDRLDEAYWTELKARLEQQLTQDEILIRAIPVSQLQ
jgi:hypothetical protein